MEIPVYVVYFLQNRAPNGNKPIVGVFQNDFVANMAIQRIIDEANRTGYHNLSRDDFDIDEIYGEQVYWNGAELGHWEEPWTPAQKAKCSPEGSKENPIDLTGDDSE